MKYKTICEPKGSIVLCRIQDETGKDVVHFSIRETEGGMLGFGIEFKPKGIIKGD